MSLKQTPLDPSKIVVDSKEYSKYIQTSLKLSTKLTFDFPKLCVRLKPYSSSDANKLATEIKKRNVFARHSWENSFYVNRATELSNRTVIEVYRRGQPDEIIDESQKVASIFENVSILSSILVIKRGKYQKLMGIHQKLGTDFYLIIGKDFRFLRSKSEPVPIVSGISIDNRFMKRFRRCGFDDLITFCLANNKLSRRLISTINWLIESREDPQLSAAIVKTSIALESLLVFNKSEPLSKSLSERSAFLLSPEASTRKKISKLIKHFYTERSKVVHGSNASVPLYIVESVDRLIVLLCLVIATNRNNFHTKENIQNWCEDIKWGHHQYDIYKPFSDLYLKNALKLFVNK